jgi:hypothetical protein
MVMDRAAKAYLYKNMLGDAWEFLKGALEDVDFDRERWLHKVGLSTYSPAKSTIGGVSLFILGGVVGAVAALAFAPRTGTELRAEVKEKARRAMEQAKSTAAESDLRA